MRQLTFILQWTTWLADDCSAHGMLTVRFHFFSITGLLTQNVVAKGPGPNRDYAIIVNTSTIRSRDVWKEFPTSLESLGADLFEPR